MTGNGSEETIFFLSSDEMTSLQVQATPDAKAGWSAFRKMKLYRKRAGGVVLISIGPHW